MKSSILLLVCIGLTIGIIACNKNNSQVPAPAIQKPATGFHPTLQSLTGYVDSSGSKFIPMDTANAMISSYLYSINSTVNDTDVRSFSINADSLRAYLANGSIKSIKLIFAHTLDYMHSGNIGRYAGYQSGALTIIIAGYDNAGTYQYYGGNVLDHAEPCPYTCPSSGAAANDLLQ